MYQIESRAFRAISNAIIENSDCINLSILEAAYNQQMIHLDPLEGLGYITTADLQLIADTFSDIGDIRAIA